MAERDLVLLGYDVISDRRRARVLAAVRAFGIGGQLSAHECLLSRPERRELWRRIAALVDPDEDRVLLLALDPRLAVETFGTALPPRPVTFHYVG
jgi:CRISPR-associated protein Cas2